MAAITGASVTQATIVKGFRSGLYKSEWRAQLEPLALSQTAFTELRQIAVRSAVQAAGTIWRIRDQAKGESQVAAGALAIARAPPASSAPAPPLAHPPAPAPPALQPAIRRPGAYRNMSPPQKNTVFLR